MRAAVLFGLAMLIGCEKKDEGGVAIAEGTKAVEKVLGNATRNSNAKEKAAAPDHPVADVEAIQGDYRANPAAADKKYKGKTFRVDVVPAFVRQGKETVAVYESVRVRFASEDEVARIGNPSYQKDEMEWVHHYRVVTKFVGNSGKLLEFSGARVVETLPGHRRQP
jgi:hypothetical protein